jgi:hypothetical protein
MVVPKKKIQTVKTNNMVLGFKTIINGKPTGFPEKILAGTKIHSIRTGNRWKPGMVIHPATGVRTRHYKQITESPLRVVSVQAIEILFVEKCSTVVVIDGLFGYESSMEQDKQVLEILAKNDGFECFEDFAMGFQSIHPGELFTGQIIHWTDYRY